MKILRNEKILVTGLTGQIGFPLAAKLAQDNEVWGLARFRDESKRQRVEALGIATSPVDLANPDFRGLPGDFTYVIHLAIFGRPGLDFDHALRINAEGTGLLMSHCRKARGFFVMSSMAVYEWPEDPNQPVKETDPLGGLRPAQSPTYSVSKIGQEAVARFSARQLNLPTIIARMNVSYGPQGGVPAYHFDMMLAGEHIPIVPDRPSVCSPIHQDDINTQIAGLLHAASTPATIVNWGGDDPVDVETYCNYMGEITGLQPNFHRIGDGMALRLIVSDNARRRGLVGDCRIEWRDGMRQMIAVRHPELKLKA